MAMEHDLSAEIWGFIELGEKDSASKIASEIRRLAGKLKLRACGLLISEHATIEDLSEDLKPYLPDKLYLVSTQANGNPELVTEAILDMVRRYGPTLLILSTSPNGTDVASRLAARLNVGLCSGVVDIEKKGDRLVARKAIYEGKAHALMGWNSGPPYIATMDLSVLDNIPSESKRETEVIKENLESKSPGIELLGRWKADRETADIREADVVVSIGNGLKGPEEMKEIEQLAELLDAVVGGSRVARYRGLVPEERQVGISGKQISASIYLALGISGAAYHLMGIRDVKHVIAVNMDKTANIFNKCELGVVADLHEVVIRLIEVIKKEK